MVNSYLPHATPTTELKELVAALQPDLHWHQLTLSASKHHWSATNQRDSDKIQFLEQTASYINIVRQWVRSLLLPHCTLPQ